MKQEEEGDWGSNKMFCLSRYIDQKCSLFISQSKMKLNSGTGVQSNFCQRVSGILYSSLPIFFKLWKFIDMVYKMSQALSEHLPYFFTYTHAHLWFPPLFLAVNHHYSKNWDPSILTHNLWLIFIGMKQFFFFFFEKKNSKWPTQKNWVFQLFQKLSNFCQNFMDSSLG